MDLLFFFFEHNLSLLNSLLFSVKCGEDEFESRHGFPNLVWSQGAENIVNQCISPRAEEWRALSWSHSASQSKVFVIEMRSQRGKECREAVGGSSI